MALVNLSTFKGDLEVGFPVVIYTTKGGLLGKELCKTHSRGELEGKPGLAVTDSDGELVWFPEEKVWINATCLEIWGSEDHGKSGN